LAPDDWLAIGTNSDGNFNMNLTNNANAHCTPMAFLSTAPQIQFHFHAVKKSKGARGFEVHFQRGKKLIWHLNFEN
jgi:hypothetical protein